MKRISLILGCLVAMTCASLANESTDPVSTTVEPQKMINTQGIVESKQAMKVGHRVFLVASMKSKYAQAILRRFGVIEPKEFVASK